SMPFCCNNFAIVSPTGPPPIIATFLSLSKFICLSVSIRIVIQKWHITFRGLAKWRKSKHKCSVLHKSSIEELNLNLALNPPFRQTDVSGSFFLFHVGFLSFLVQYLVRQIVFPINLMSFQKLKLYF